MGAAKKGFMEMREAEYGHEDETTTTTNTETGLSFELSNLISIDKATIRQKVDAVSMSIQEGWTDPLDALIVAKKGKEFFDALEKNVRPYAEAKPIGKGLVKYSTEISEAMTGVKYDYSHCDDSEWALLSLANEQAKAKLTERENFLKGVTKDMEIVDTDTGETYTIHPPVKSGKLGLKLEIK